MNKNEWQEFNKDKYIKYTENYIAIKPDDKHFKITPLFCPLCNFPISSYQDSINCKLDNVCEMCNLYWVTSNKEEYKNGWKPSGEKWINYLEMKKMRYVRPIIFK
jgi:hypothetical protein